MFKNIHFITGDATYPIGIGNKIICHVCNDIGGWGRGFVLALNKRWKLPEQKYRQWHDANLSSFKLGSVQFVRVEFNIWIANMIGQHDVLATLNGPPIRYEAIDQSLKKVAIKAKQLNASIHMPRIGCGLAGGTWDKIEPLIKKNLDIGIPILVYDLP